MLYDHTHTYAGRMRCIGLMGIREELHWPAFVAGQRSFSVSLAARRAACETARPARVTKELRDPVGIAVKVALST